MSNRPVRSQVIFGLQVIGAGTPITTIITGYRACGSLLPESVYFGHRDGGAGEAVFFRLIRGSGGPPSGFLGGSIIGTAITGKGDWGGGGGGTNFHIKT